MSGNASGILASNRCDSAIRHLSKAARATALVLFAATVFAICAETATAQYTNPTPGYPIQSTFPTVPTIYESTETTSGCYYAGSNGTGTEGPAPATEYVIAPYFASRGIQLVDAGTFSANVTSNQFTTTYSYLSAGLTGYSATVTYSYSLSAGVVNETLVDSISYTGPIGSEFSTGQQTTSYTYKSTFDTTTGVQAYSFDYESSGTATGDNAPTDPLYLCSQTNSGYERGSTTYNWVSDSYVPPTIASSLPAGQPGVPYPSTVLISGGTPPYPTISSPGLPSNLSIDQNGNVSGTPATAGQYTAMVSVTDSEGETAGPTPVSITINPGAQMCTPPAVPFPSTGSSWSQADDGWGDEHYDNANGPDDTIADQGCLLTALAYSMDAAGQSYDPGTLNTKLEGIMGAYSAPQGTTKDSGGRIDASVAVGLATNGALKFDKTYSSPTTPTTPTALDANLCAATPRPVIVQVPSSGVSGKHFVVVTGKVGNSYSILDPGHQDITDLSTYGISSTHIYGVVKPPVGKDPSELDFSLLDNATLLVTAPDGSQTGIDLSTDAVLKGSPGAAYFVEDNSISTDRKSVAATETMYSVQTFLPADGTYTITVQGLQLGTYNLVIQALDVNGSPLSYITLPGIANVGSTSTFQVKFAATPGSVTTAVSMTTFASALADVYNGYKSTLITQQPIEEVLTALLTIARDASYRQDRIGYQLERLALGVFRQVVIAETGKQITGLEPQILLNDAAYLVSQIPSDQH